MDITEVKAACDEVRAAKLQVEALDVKIDVARSFVLGAIPGRKDLIAKLGEANERLDKILGLADPAVNAIAAAAGSATPVVNGVESKN